MVPNGSERTPDDVTSAGVLAETFAVVRQQMKARILGQPDVIENLLITLLASGHALFVGVPGLAKTLLIRSLAECCRLSHKRVQFTPDLMPADITGTEILNTHTNGQKGFVFAPGPIFANLILADEINRTPPKTQAALLECMQEGHVTSNATSHALPVPFHVFATQNPIEQEGTFALPEAQLDRFMLAVEVDYPSYDDEVSLLRAGLGASPVPLKAVLSEQALKDFQALCRRVPVSEACLTAAARLVRATRPQDATAPAFVRENVALGAGPRAAQHVLRAAQARALLQGRFSVDKDDIMAMARPALAHRVLLNYQGQADGIATRDVIETACASCRNP